MKIRTYLDTAGTGLVSEKALKATEKYHHLLTTNTSQSFWDFLTNDLPEIRQNMAKFIGVDSSRMAFIPNFSYGFSMFLTSVKPHKKRVLFFENDYPSLMMPFQQQGFTISKMKLHDEEFEMNYNAIEEKIKQEKIEILAVSHVQYLTGFTLDISALAAICKRHNVLFLVDGTQSLGALPIAFDDSGIDVFMASNYKWMNGGFGSAVACFADGVLERYPPNIAGYGSHHLINNKMVFKADAKSYEPGHFNYGPYLSLGVAVKEKQNVGVENIAAHNKKLTEHFLMGFAETGQKLVGPTTLNNRSSLLVIKANDDLHNKLLANGIKTTYRNNTIRIAFHFTNSIQEVDGLLEVLKIN